MNQKLRSILLVDDDEPTVFLNSMIIEELDCAQEIKTANSGEEALKYLTSTSEDNDAYPTPDLIFLDINMPAMNGWEFLEQYRKLDSAHKGKVMIVMLTTSLFPEDKQKSMDVPEVSGFENKPLTKEKLEKILDAYFRA